MINTIAKEIASKYGYNTDRCSNMNKVIWEINSYIQENYVSAMKYKVTRKAKYRLEDEVKSLKKEISGLRQCLKQLRINSDESWKVRAENGKQTTSKPNAYIEGSQATGICRIETDSD